MKTDTFTLQSTLQQLEYDPCQVCFIDEDYIGIQLEKSKRSVGA